MKTTLSLPDAVAVRLKREANQRGVAMCALVGEALRRLLEGWRSGAAPW